MTKKKSASPIEIRHSKIHGNGIFAIRAIAQDEQVIEYKGRRISSQQANADYGDNSDTGHTFLFTLNDKWIVDGNVNGNAARWINHSCDPNCGAVIYVNIDYQEEKDKVWIEALRPIKAGEELTYDYGIVLAERHTSRLKKIWACRCGSESCTGTMLKDKRSQRG
jgi:uncharacterized protein